MSRILFAIAAILIAVPARAATYYVSTAGNDANSCATATSISTPTRTIMNALKCLVAGDTLYIRGGTYGESLLLLGGTQGASWSSPITISAYKGETVTIKPPAGSDFVVVMRGSGPGATDGPRYQVWNGIIFDGTNVSSHGVYITAWDATINPPQAPAHHIRFTNVRITNVPHGQALLATWGSDGVQISNCEIDHIDGPSQSGQNTQGIYGGGHDMLVENCSIHDNWGYALSNINSNSYGGTPFNVNNHIIRNNRVYANGLGGTTGGGINLGEGTGHQVYNNVVYNNSGSGIILGGGDGANRTAIYNNTLYGNTAAGIEIRGGQTATNVRNNVSYGNTTDYTDSGSSTMQANNLFSTDPLFVNPSAGDFKLQTNSPAVNTGTTIALVKTDKDGTARPQGGAYDIGAYETAEGGPTSPGPDPGQKIPSAPTGLRVVSP
jgi:Right handed beta helix region